MSKYADLYVDLSIAGLAVYGLAIAFGVAALVDLPVSAAGHARCPDCVYEKSAGIDPAEGASSQDAASWMRKGSTE